MRLGELFDSFGDLGCPEGKELSLLQGKFKGYDLFFVRKGWYSQKYLNIWGKVKMDKDLESPVTQLF